MRLKLMDNYVNSQGYSKTGLEGTVRRAFRAGFDAGIRECDGSIQGERIFKLQREVSQLEQCLEIAEAALARIEAIRKSDKNE